MRRPGPGPGVILAAVLAAAAPARAQLPPPIAIPSAESAAPPNSEKAFSSVEIHERPAPTPVVIEVSPSGSDKGDGSAARPFATLVRAQAAVRALNRSHSVTVRLADGVYRLSAPLRFGVEDGGRDGYVVRWEAAKDAHPVISGGASVGGWRQADAARDIITLGAGSGRIGPAPSTETVRTEYVLKPSAFAAVSAFARNAATASVISSRSTASCAGRLSQ